MQRDRIVVKVDAKGHGHSARVGLRGSVLAGVMALVAGVGLLAGCGSDSPKAGTKAGQRAVGALSGSFCDKAKQLKALGPSLFDRGKTTDTSPAGRLKTMKAFYTDIGALYAKLESGAPSEIKGDVSYFAAGIRKFLPEMEKAKSVQDLTKLSSSGGLLNGPESKAHQDALGAYMKGKCGVESNTRFADTTPASRAAG